MLIVHRKLSVFATSVLHYSIPEYGFEGKDFPGISITGGHCELKCKHCFATILRRMKWAETPTKLVKLGEELAHKGIKGILISGGSNHKGEVEFEEFSSAIRKLKDLGLKIFMHTGIVDDKRARMLRDIGIDMVLYEIPTSNGVIREIFNLRNRTIGDYYKGLMSLIEHKVPVAPHLVVGLDRNIDNEINMINTVSNIGCNAFVMVIFTPLSGTPLEKASPPSIDRVLTVMSYARRKIHAPLSLGCMRPRSEPYRIVERKAVDLEFDGIAFPSLEALDYAKTKRELRFFNECCAAIAFY